MTTRSERLKRCLANCEAYEVDNPHALYSNDEWGYPSGIGTVRIYPQFPWRPLTAPEYEIECRDLSSNALGEGRERGILREASSAEGATSTVGLGVAVSPAQTYKQGETT